MLFDWVRRPTKQWSAVPTQCQWGSISPSLEVLEQRLVPAAIRALPGFTVNSLPANDDNSTGSVNLGFTADFFGVTANSVFVNNNGNITFGSPLSQYTPTGLNSDNGGIPIIAPFFADVDTTVGNVVTYGTGTLCGEQAFYVNYVNVGYYSSHVDKLDSFQLILVARPETGAGNFDIEFNYNQVQWETGDASGGTDGLGGESAHVGYSNGSGAAGTNFELPGSGVNGALLDGGPDSLVSNDLQASTPGRYHFLVRGGQVVQATTAQGNVTSETTVLDPFRFITDPTTDIQRGNLTLINVVPIVQSTGTATDACLDITAGATVGGPTTFTGPITVVFTQLPTNVQLVNQTGTTAAGLPYITSDVEDLPQNAPVLRVAIQLHNPSLQAPSTFFAGGLPVQVFAGPFDPTMD